MRAVAPGVATILTRTATFLSAAVFALCALTFAQPSAKAQSSPTDVPQTPLQKQLAHMDFGVLGAGEFNTTVSGPVVVAASDQGQNVTQYASNTLGALIMIRYVAKPYVGFEFNYGYARYTENYSVAPNQIQTKASEYTFGYVAHPPHEIFGLKPYLGAGAGTIAFKPTPGGGEGAPEKARMAYYYAAGVEAPLGEHFGIRGGFRQLFFLAPDFGQNYLTILKHTSTYEPNVGFYLRY